MPRLDLSLCTMLVALTGCGRLGDILVEPRNDDDEVYSTPTGDGSHYIAIFSEPETPSNAMARRWKKHATKVCEGDYLLMSDNAAERRRGGFVESKVHEGWVRCLSPDVALEETSDSGDKVKKPANKEPAQQEPVQRRTTLRQRLADRSARRAAGNPRLGE